MIILRVFVEAPQPVLEIEVEDVPLAMAISSNDHFVALKFGGHVRIVNIATRASYHHQLPQQNCLNGVKDHLISFSTDSLSFAAATRFQPEKVLTYFCACQNSSSGIVAESSAPYVRFHFCSIYLLPLRVERLQHHSFTSPH